MVSLDDFHLTSAGLAATETSLFLFDKALYDEIDVGTSVFEPIRVMAANRLAENGRQSSETFRQFNR